MEEIDMPFRPCKDFVVVWALIAAVLVAITQPWNFGLPWYSEVAFAALIPFLATFVLYGPVLLLRQVRRSETRGRLVLTAFIETVSILAIMLVVCRLIIFRDGELSPIIVILLSIGAILYLNIRIKKL